MRVSEHGRWHPSMFLVCRVGTMLVSSTSLGRSVAENGREKNDTKEIAGPRPRRGPVSKTAELVIIHVLFFLLTLRLHVMVFLSDLCVVLSDGGVWWWLCTVVVSGIWHGVFRLPLADRTASEWACCCGS